MQLSGFRLAMAISVSSAVGLAATASATPYVTPADCCVVPADGPGIPKPSQVPGKAFSDRLDRDDTGAASPEQNLIWDGNGGTGLGRNYNTSLGGIREQEVDAIAAPFDLLFSQVGENRSALLFSVDGDRNIYQEEISGTPGRWADAATIDDMNPIRDLDGLEVWGAEGPDPDFDDSGRYSLEGDPAVPGGPRVSIWEYDPFANTSSVVYTIFDIGTAIGLDDAFWDQLDVDAMMSFESSVLFSIDEIVDPASGAQLFDGGEIFQWDGTAGFGTASFLEHGGHTWDTAFDVAGTFDLSSENVNALESVAAPEPGTVMLLGFGFLLIAVRRFRAARPSREGLAVVAALLLVTALPLTAQSAETGAQISRRVLALCDELMGMLSRADIPEAQREALRDELNRSKTQYLAENHCTALDVLDGFIAMTDDLRESGFAMHAEMLRNHGWMTRNALQATIPPSPCYDPRLGMQPQVELLQSTVEGLSTQFDFGHPMLMTREGDGEMWTEVTIPGLFPRFDEFGRPAVPYFTRLIAVPMGAEIRMTAQPTMGQMLPMNLLPFQDEAAMHEHTPDDYAGEIPPEEVFDDPPFFVDRTFYAEDAAYPPQACMAEIVGTFRDLQIAEVSCAAGRYNPVSDEFMPYQGVRVDIAFEGGSGIFMSDRGMGPFENSPGLPVESVLNFETALAHVAHVLVPLGCLGEELLILTHPDLLVQAQRLAQHKKNSQGIMTNIMIVNDGAGPGPDGTLEIHLTIAARYIDCAVRPSYLLAFGDVEYVPTFYPPNPVKRGVIASDYPYSLADPLESADIMNMDFGVGRLPVDPEQAEVVVDKIIQYETNPPQFQEAGFFYDSITIASQFECCRLDSNFPDGTDQRTFIQTVEDVRNRLLALGYGVERIYEESVDPDYTGNPTPLYLIDGVTPLPFGLLPPFAWDGDRQDVIDAFNDGRFLVIHLDHAGSWGWGHPSFNGNDATALVNGDRLPFLLGYNCSSGYVDNETDQDHDVIDHPDSYVPFTERLIRNPNGGVIGTIAATRTTFAHGNIMIKGALDSAFPSMDPAFGSSLQRRRFGDMLNHGRLYMLHRYGASSNTRRHAFLYNLYGDPTTRLWTQKPNQLPEIPILIEEFPDFIDIQYQVEGAIITAYQETPDLGLRPIGRAPVQDGHAMVEHFIEPIAGVAMQYQASMPGAIGTPLEIPVGAGSAGCLDRPVELAFVLVPLVWLRMRRMA